MVLSRLLLVALLLGLFAPPRSVRAQHVPADATQRAVPERHPVLVAVPEDVDAVVPPALPASKQGAAATATFDVSYDDAMPRAAREAFEAATEIWATHLASPVPITVSVAWDSLAEKTLGAAGPRTAAMNFTGAPQEDTWYPIALAEALYGQNATGTQPDIVARFNSELDVDGDGTLDWDFNTDPSQSTPSGKFHFLTVVLHELGHGLGFFGSCGVDEASGDGSWGFAASTGGTFPLSFDRYAEDVNEVALLDTVAYPNPSAYLADLLQSGDLYFTGEAARDQLGGAPVPLYAPRSYENGSSYSHLDESTFRAGTRNALMTPKLNSREQLYDIGPVGCGVFSDIGWPLGPACQTALPVVLLAFDARIDDGALVVAWETASETGTAGFEVQMRAGEGEWTPLTFVAGRGEAGVGAAYTHRTETLPAGRYALRLRQVALDGADVYSPEVEVHIPLDAPYAFTAPYPDPFTDRTAFTLTVARDQRVRVEVYDLLGRRVAHLLDAPLAAEVPRHVALDGADLAAGTYLVVVSGETFRDARRVVRVR